MTVEINAATGVSAVQPGSVQSGDLAAGAIGSGDLPAGSVIHVVQEISNTETRTAGAAGNVDVGPTVTITPTSSSSKIYVIHSAGGYSQNPDDITLGIKRNGSIVHAMGRYGYHNQTGFESSPFSLHYLDSPNSTSSITYTPFIGQKNNGGDLEHNATPSTGVSGQNAITIAMEIAG